MRLGFTPSVDASGKKLQKCSLDRKKLCDGIIIIIILMEDEGFLL
jgi:hypothetical protein